MAYTPFTQDMDIIQKLDDEPNDVGGITAAEMKAKFDEGGNAIKNWINKTFIPEANTYTPFTVNGKSGDASGNVSLLSADLGIGRNLLLNANFAAPYLVNQRGFTSTTVDESYTVDGWNLDTDGGSVTLNSGYITLACTGNFASFGCQLETLSAGTYTLSVKFQDGTITSATLVWDGSTVVYEAFIWGFLAIAIHGPYPRAYIQVQNGYTQNIVKMKLEPGSISTLAYDTPPTPAEQELNRQACMRYCLALPGGTRARMVQYSADYMDFTFPIPGQFRIAPTIIGTLYVKQTSGGIAESGFSHAAIISTPGSLLIRSTKVSHGLSDGNLQAEGLVILSAEL